MTEQNLVTIEGTIDEIIYKNDETGYAVFNVDIGESCVTAVGTVPYIMQGESICARGSYGMHSVYGQQFKISEYERILPKTASAIQSFLGSGAIKGVGEVLASRIVERFGEHTLEIIESDEECLWGIKGITRKKAKQISDFIKYQMGIKTVMDYFNSLELSPQVAARAYKLFGSDTIENINHNPYVLCELGVFVPFDKADRVALKLGIEAQDYQRIRAGLLFCLRHNIANGHTYLPLSKLLGVAMGLLDIDEQDVMEGALENMAQNQDIVRVIKDDIECVYLPHMYEAESDVAQRIAQMADKKVLSVSDIEDYIEDIEKRFNIEYAGLQRKAIIGAVQSNVFVLTGGPGTGKTTTIRAIIEIFKLMGKEVALCAPTGRAAQRMSQLCDYEAKTIHRLFEVDHKSMSDMPVFLRNSQNPIDADVVIVDEASMLDILLFDALLKGTKKSASIILVGDYYQLPSVGPGNVLKDIIASECVDVVELDEIFRQAAQSLIVLNAHNIKNGEYPELIKTDSDFFFIKAENEQKLSDMVCDLVKRRLPKAYGLDMVNDIQVITPTKKGVIGTKDLNHALQSALNPDAAQEKRYKDIVFKTGDKVMQVRNNYDLEWVKLSDNSYGSGVFNGDVGRIAAINFRDEVLSVIFDDRVAEYSFEDLDDLELAYAMTVHKSQGSEFRAVVIPLLGGPRQLLNREILYTAMTRAKELLIIVGDRGTVMKMVDNKRHSARYSMLKNMIRMCAGI